MRDIKHMVVVAKHRKHDISDPDNADYVYGGGVVKEYTDEKANALITLAHEKYPDHEVIACGICDLVKNKALFENDLFGMALKLFYPRIPNFMVQLENNARILVRQGMFLHMNSSLMGYLIDTGREELWDMIKRYHCSRIWGNWHTPYENFYPYDTPLSEGDSHHG